MQDTDQIQKELMATLSFTVQQIEKAISHSFSLYNWRDHQVRQRFGFQSHDIPLFNGYAAGFSTKLHLMCAQKMRNMYYDTDINPEACSEAFKEVFRHEEWSGFLHDMAFEYEKILAEEDPDYKKVLIMKNKIQVKKIELRIGSHEARDKDKSKILDDVSHAAPLFNEKNYLMDHAHFIERFEGKLEGICQRAQNIMEIVIRSDLKPSDVPVQDIRVHIASKQAASQNLDQAVPQDIQRTHHA